MKTYLGAGVGLLIGIVIGWAIWDSPSGQAPGAPSEAPATTQATPAQPKPQTRSEPEEAYATANDEAIEALAAQDFDGKMGAFDKLKTDPSIDSMILALQTARSMSDSELRRALEEVSKRPMGGMGDFLTPFYLFSSWVQRNPAAAHEFYQNTANPMQRGMYSQSLFSAWAASDPDGAIAAIQAIENQRERRGALRMAAMSIASTDPQRAFDLIQNDDFTDGGWSYRMVFSNWTGQNPGKAWSAIQTMPPGRSRQFALQGYFSALARQDRNLAANEALQLASASERSEAMGVVLRDWLAEDFDAATGFISNLPDDSAKEKVLNDLSWQFGQAHPERALAWVSENTDGELQDRMVGNIIRHFAQSDLEKARAYVEALPFGEAYENSLHRVSDVWAKKDPRGALGWLSSMPEGNERRNAFNSVFRRFAESDPEGATAYLIEQGETLPEHNRLLDRLSEQMVKQSPQVALEWAQSLPTEEMRNRAHNQTLDDWASIDAPGLAAYLQAQDDPERFERYADDIGENWAKKDPAGAAEWALSIEQENAQVKAVADISKQWLEHNSYEASAWIAELPEGRVRDAGVTQLIDSIYRSDPATAFEWLPDISDSKTRTQQTERVYRQLRNREDAEEILRNSGLPVDEINALLAK